MKIVFIFLCFLNIIYADLFEFIKIDKINRSYKDKNYADTIKYLYELDSDNAIINYNLATAYYKNKEYKNAIKYYKRALGEGVNEFDRLYNLGNSYFKNKEYKNAIISYNQASKIKIDKNLIYNLKLAKYKLEHKSLDKILNPKKRLEKKIKYKKNSKIKNRKLTKKEINRLKKELKNRKLKKELKKLIQKKFKDEKVPILMYKID